MDVTGTDPRARTGLFLWPWAATGYSNMNSSVTGGANAQVTPPLGLSPPGTGSFEQGLQIQHQQQQQHQQSQQQDSSLESFYSRLPYSAGGAVPSLQQMQQHQRQQREAAAAAAAQAISEMQGQQQQSGRMGPITQAPQQSQQQVPQPPPPPPFDQCSALMNDRQTQQQPAINSASSSPLNNSAYHNPSLSPNSQQQQHQQQQQFQRHYSSAGSLQNVTGGALGSSASPLDGRISSSASPSNNSVAPSYCLKRPTNEFSSATAMALALQAVAKGDRQMPPPPPSISIQNSSNSSQAVEHLQGGGVGGDAFTSMNSTNYLFQTPTMSKGPGVVGGGSGIHGRNSSEAAAMAAAMAAQAARDVANEMVMDPRAASSHPLSGFHTAGGFLPDFLSSSSAATLGDTKMDHSGAVGIRGGIGPFDGPPTMTGGLGMMDGLSGIYGHAAKGYKCKICQHVLNFGNDTSLINVCDKPISCPSISIGRLESRIAWEDEKSMSSQGLENRDCFLRPFLGLLQFYLSAISDIVISQGHGATGPLRYSSKSGVYFSGSGNDVAMKQDKKGSFEFIRVESFHVTQCP